jgi:hypothetical protein
MFRFWYIYEALWIQNLTLKGWHSNSYKLYPWLVERCMLIVTATGAKENLKIANWWSLLFFFRIHPYFMTNSMSDIKDWHYVLLILHWFAVKVVSFWGCLWLAKKVVTGICKSLQVDISRFIFVWCYGFNCNLFHMLY